MKKTILNILFLIIAGLPLSAQIVVTNATFPTVGDTLQNAVDSEPMGIVITEPGGNQNWDFSSLIPVSTNEIIILPASEGSNSDAFPSADAVVSTGLVGSSDFGVGNLYLNITDTEYEVLGYAGADPVGIGINVAIPFTPPIVQKRSPMEFFDINNTAYNVNYALPTDSLPAQILDLLPATIAPDSFRLISNTTRNDIVDAWGNLTIPGGTYEVLREKRTEIRETIIEVLVSAGPFSNWVPVTQYFDVPGGGQDTTITYTFTSNVEKEDIAVITVDNTDEVTPTYAIFKNNAAITTSTADVSRSLDKADIYAQPNPAINNTRINIVNVKPGQYSFKLFNILGKELIQRDLEINGGDYAFPLSLDTLTKGTYLYNVADANGKIISTKRLMVIRP